MKFENNSWLMKSMKSLAYRGASIESGFPVGMSLMVILLTGFGCLTHPNWGWAQPDSIPWEIRLKDVVVTAQYAPTSAEAAIHPITVVKKDQWIARGQNTLSEVLQQELNMQVSPDPILGTGLSIQGLDGQNVQIMIDGIPVVGRLGGSIDLTQLNLSQFERMEIIKGSMSAQYGSNAAGGVINLISKQHQVNKWSADVGGQIESIGLNNLNLRLGGKLGAFQLDGGIWRYQAWFGSEEELRERQEVTDEDGQTYQVKVVPWNPKKQLGCDANLTFRPSDSLRIRYGFRGFTEDLMLYGDIRRPVFRPYAIDQEFTTQRRDHHLHAEYWMSPRLYWKTAIGWNTFNRFRDTRRWDLESDTTSLEPNGRDTSRYTGLLGRTNFSWLVDPVWNMQFGLEYLRETAAGQRILVAENGETEPSMTNLAGWVNLRFRPSPQWTLEGNVRLGYNSRYAHPFIPAFHVLWEPASAWQMRLGYARGFRAPSIQELFFNFIDVNHFIIGNPDLEAENSHNVQLNLNWKGPDEGLLAFRINGTLFYNKVQNRITLVEFEPVRFSYDNLENFETHGGSLELSWQPIRDLQIKVSGAFTRLLNPLNDEFSEVERFVGLPEMTNEISYRIPFLLVNTLLVHRYIGRQDRYVLGDAGEPELGFVEDYHLLDFSLNRQFWEGRLTVGAGVKNILDQDQANLVGTGGGGAHSGGTGSRLVAFGRSYFLRLGFSY